MEENKKKRGRPRKDNARKIPVKTMLNDEEMYRLKAASILSGQSQMDILRIGAMKQIAEIEKIYPNESFDDWELGYYDDPEDCYDENGYE